MAMKINTCSEFKQALFPIDKSNPETIDGIINARNCQSRDQSLHNPPWTCNCYTCLKRNLKAFMSEKGGYSVDP